METERYKEEFIEEAKDKVGNLYLDYVVLNAIDNGKSKYDNTVDGLVERLCNDQTLAGFAFQLVKKGILDKSMIKIEDKNDRTKYVYFEIKPEMKESVEGFLNFIDNVYLKKEDFEFQSREIDYEGNFASRHFYLDEKLTEEEIEKIKNISSVIKLEDFSIGDNYYNVLFKVPNPPEEDGRAKILEHQMKDIIPNVKLVKNYRLIQNQGDDLNGEY